MIAREPNELLAAGEVIAGKFKVLRALGTGACASVFEAQHLVSGKKAAVKWARGGGVESAAEVARLLEQAGRAARVQHPHLVELYDVGVHRDGYFIMWELLQGETLAQRVARARVNADELPALFVPAVFGVAAAHAAGVLHGSLQPDNIFLCNDADGGFYGPKVLAFGEQDFARLAAPNQTRSGRVAGTPNYLAPEQVVDEGNISTATDVYGLGVTLYHALSGAVPYSGATYRAITERIARGSAASLARLRPGLPSKLYSVVTRAMALKPKDRFPSAEELGHALLDSIGGSGRHVSLPPARDSGKSGRHTKASIPPPLAPSLSAGPPAPPSEPASLRSVAKAETGPGRSERSVVSTIPPPRRSLASGKAAASPPEPNAAAETGAQAPHATTPPADEHATAVSVKPKSQLAREANDGIQDGSALLEETDERPVGLGKQLGRYEVIADLASGGMASVFVARAVGVAGFERLVAVKLLHPHIAHQPEFIEMFLDEARLAARIRHPNVVPTLDISDTADDGYFLVMEYIEGAHLGELVRAAEAKGERLPPRIVAKIVIDALDGLGAAHLLTDDRGESLGIVHRDVSPANVMVGTDGIARLTDFGVAKAEGRLTTTRKGQVKGKLTYMAPEHASSGHADQRSDLFSMGIVLWEALTGERLFRAGNHAAILNKILSAPIPRPSSVAAELKPFDRLLEKALHRDPAGRFQTAEEFITALERVARANGGVSTMREVAKYSRYLVDARLREQRARIDQGIAKLGRVEVRDDRRSHSGTTAPHPVADAELDPATPLPSDLGVGRPSKATKAALALVALVFLSLAAWAFASLERAPEERVAAPQAADSVETSAPTAVAPAAAPADHPALRGEAEAATIAPGEQPTSPAEPDTALVEQPESPPADSATSDEASAAQTSTTPEASDGDPDPDAAAPAEPTEAPRVRGAGTTRRSGPGRSRTRPTLSWMDF